MSTPIYEIGPIAGNAVGIRSRAERFTRAAEAIADATRFLQRVKGDTTASETSDAVAALAKSIDDVDVRLTTLRPRYEVAGSELSTFANVLEEAQRIASAAADRRDELVQDLRRAEMRAETAREDADQAARGGDAVSAQEAIASSQRWAGQSEGYESQLATQGTLHHNAVESVRTAGDKAAEAIAQAIENDGVNDSLWDNIMGWVADNAEWLSVLKDILGAITAIVGLLSLVFPVLAVVALGLGALTLGLSFLLAASGKGSWLDVGLDLVGMLTFGVGAVAARGVSLSIRGLQGAHAASVLRTGATSTRALVPTTRPAAMQWASREFESLLPAGTQLLTNRNPLLRFVLETNGRAGSQFEAIAAAMRTDPSRLASLWLSRGDDALAVVEGAGRVGAGLDILGLADQGLAWGSDAVDFAPLDAVADAIGGAKDAMTAPLPSLFAMSESGLISEAGGRER